MKKVGLLFTVLVVLALTGCGITENGTENSTENSTGMSTGISIETTGDITTDVVSGSVFTGEENGEKTIKREKEIFSELSENRRDLEQEELLAYLPECEFEELKPTKIINIDDVVQNCITEEKKGYLSFDGGATLRYITYFLSKEGKVLEQMFGFHDSYPVCKIEKDTAYNFMAYMPTKELSYIESEMRIPSFEKFFKEKGNIIDNIVTVRGGNNNVSPNNPFKSLLSLYCREWCKDWKDLMAIQEGNHYIVSSMINPNGGNYINSKYSNLQLMYSIDGKIYNPGMEKKNYFKTDYYYPKQSKRYFESFSGDVAILKRISDGKVSDIHYEEFNKYDEIIIKNPIINYTIETCEILLNK